jgi:hypothetical protein
VGCGLVRRRSWCLPGLSPLDTYQFLSQAVEAPLGNVVDTNCTSVARLRKDCLPGRFCDLG